MAKDKYDDDEDNNSLTEYTHKLQKYDSSIMDYENNWTDKNEKLLMRWAEKAAGYEWLHNMARINFKKTHDYLSYPTIILSSITGVGGLLY